MPPAPDRSILDDPSLSLAQKILLTTDGTVTQLLEILTGERMHVEKIEHAVQRGGPAALCVAGDEPVLSRKILLCGPSGPCMYAHSLFVPQRLPRGMQAALHETDTPIGQLWKAAKLETFREIIAYGRHESPELAALLGTRAPLLSRSYLVYAGGLPMGLITEQFPCDRFRATQLSGR